MAAMSKVVKKGARVEEEEEEILKEESMWDIFFGGRPPPTLVVPPNIWIGGAEDGKEKNVLVRERKIDLKLF
jgi:hypothetical protein